MQPISSTQLIQFGCNSSTFQGMNSADALGTIARLGFRYTDIATDFHLDLDSFANRSAVVKMRDNLALYNLRVADIYLRLPHLLSDERTQRQFAQDKFKALLPFIKAIEANGITLALDNTIPEDTASVNTLTTLLNTLSNAAQQADIPFSIELRADTPINKPEQAQALLGKVEALQLTLDWASLIYLGTSEKIIRDLLPRTRHILMRQAKPYALQTTFEDGAIVPKNVLTLLRDATYSGVVSFQYLPYAERYHIAEVNRIEETLAIRDAFVRGRKN